MSKFKETIDEKTGKRTICFNLMLLKVEHHTFEQTVLQTMTRFNVLFGELSLQEIGKGNRLKINQERIDTLLKTWISNHYQGKGLLAGFVENNSDCGSTKKDIDTYYENINGVIYIKVYFHHDPKVTNVLTLIYIVAHLYLKNPTTNRLKSSRQYDNIYNLADHG